MLILLTSPAALFRNGRLAEDIVEAFKTIGAQGHPAVVVSNQGKPHWFDRVFSGSNVTFFPTKARQNGSALRAISKSLAINPYDLLVLAAKDEDIQMAKNGGAVLIAAGWSSADPRVQGLGIKIESPQQLKELIDMSNSWTGHWWYEGLHSNYSIKVLGNLSGIGVDTTQQALAAKLTETVKRGGNRLNTLLIATARSLLIDGAHQTENMFWSFYPSSNSKNNDEEVLGEFTHRLRTTVSKVQLARRNQPLFIRHEPSTKRSASRNIDRTDPAEQIKTLHLNPVYKTSIKKRNVFVLDDCTTHGVSFAVAAAFLRKAGAASVTNIALGKFGNVLQYIEVELQGDPFAPIDGFTLASRCHFQGQTNSAVQQNLLTLIE